MNQLVGGERGNPGIATRHSRVLLTSDWWLGVDGVGERHDCLRGHGSCAGFSPFRTPWVKSRIERWFYLDLLKLDVLTAPNP